MFQFTEPCDTPVYVDEVEGGVPEGVWRIGRPCNEGDGEESGPQARLPDGNSQILRSYVFGPSGLWLRYAALQNLIPSHPWIAPPRPPPWRNPRKVRDQILPSGNLDTLDAAALRKSCKGQIGLESCANRFSLLSKS